MAIKFCAPQIRRWGQVANLSLAQAELRAASPEDGRRRKAGGEIALLPMEYREFQLGGQTEYVIFDHIVGGRSMSYGTVGRPPWYGFLADIFAKGFRLREEQFFVRISSNRPLAEFKDTPPVQVFLRRLSAELEKMRRASGDCLGKS